MLKKTHTQFIGWFTLIFLVSFGAMYVLGFIPSELLGGDTPNVLEVFDDSVVSAADLPTIENPIATKREYHGEFPTHISIPSIGVDARVSVPKNTSAATLDESLTHGAVYYPGSGLLADGNVFIFGHSTNWKVVNNPAYKTFNGFKDVKQGDEIRVKGSSNTYIYKVLSVTLANDDEIWVDLSSDKKLLTLSTCNTFGKKQERYVIQAEYSETLTF
jgi:LPXTG-site transpeptidase (sortase) family protein